LRVGRIQGTATLTGRSIAKRSPLIEFFPIKITFITATLPRRAARERDYYGKSGDSRGRGELEIAVSVGIY